MFIKFKIRLFYDQLTNNYISTIIFLVDSSILTKKINND